MSSKPILYLGDTSLAGAAGYLAGLMSAFGFEFDYLRPRGRTQQQQKTAH